MKNQLEDLGRDNCCKLHYGTKPCPWSQNRLWAKSETTPDIS